MEDDSTPAPPSEDAARATGWRQGLVCLRERRYWDAHECWEDSWRALGQGARREALQALIQFAAAAHKVDQARSEASRQRGMRELISSARGHLERAEAAGGAPPRWPVEALEEGLDELEAIQASWASGALTDEELEEEVAAAAMSLADRLTNATTGYQLWRQDDHGHEFLVETFSDPEEARRAQQRFEARGHKQHYWVTRDATE